MAKSKKMVSQPQAVMTKKKKKSSSGFGAFIKKK